MWIYVYHMTYLKTILLWYNLLVVIAIGIDPCITLRPIRIHEIGNSHHNISNNFVCHIIVNCK